MISDYHFGSVRVDDNTYSADLILLPDRVIGSWWRKSGHCLHPDDLTGIVEAAPDVLVIGTGSFGVMQVPADTVAFLKSNGIAPVVLKTDAACREYNERKSNGEKVAAALHLTC